MFVKNKQRVSSPHTRRYFLSGLLGGGSTELFSAHAEVFPCGGRCRFRLLSLLRIRGGISVMDEQLRGVIYSSPHTRRYFHRHRRETARAQLFSAHAEVFPRPCSATLRPWSLLRTRGGISMSCQLTNVVITSSPHTRRYFPVYYGHPVDNFLFSAHAEVFP